MTRFRKPERETRHSDMPAGPASDAQGRPAQDPTSNVQDLVDASVQRLNDLRNTEHSSLTYMVITESKHLHELMEIRAHYENARSERESDRIDAIRATDTQAVLAAAQVSATQATTLASQVALSADAMRVQVAATAQASQEGLTRALTPLQVAIDDLRRAQYEAQGQKTQVVEARSSAEDLKPIMDSIAMLTQAMHNSQGQRAQVGEDRSRISQNVAVIGAILVFISILSPIVLTLVLRP